MGDTDLEMQHSYAFGWGRRFCLGPHIAETSMFIACARILWAFDFACPPGVAVPDINDELKTWSDGFISVPRIFPVIWKPRTSAKGMLIQKEFENNQAEWRMLGFAEDER